MNKKPAHVHPSDLQGLTRLATDAAAGLIDLVEAVHQNIARSSRMKGTPVKDFSHGITELVYKSIRGATRLAGGGIDAILSQLIPAFDKPNSSTRREAFLSILNGVLGDYLAENDNPLTISMCLRSNGRPLALEKQALTGAIPQISGKLLVLAHGLCMNDLQWNRRGQDHGAVMARDLGYTPVYLNYNSGLHTSTNGREFARLLEALLKQWPKPVEKLVIIAHSMGGLVSRSACHYAAVNGYDWLRHLGKLIFLGTPHHGALLERAGNWLEIIIGAAPYVEPFSRMGKIRSSGITDLRYGNLLDEDWEGLDRFEHGRSVRQSVPLPDGVRCYAAAATTGKSSNDLHGRIVGDGLVSLNSALGHHRNAERSLPFPKSRQWIGYGMKHMDLLSRPEVGDQIKNWLAS
jgi:pimeloyl-ACP methyl ester carboxylesterase